MRSFRLLIVVLVFAAAASAQRIAIIQPTAEGGAEEFTAAVRAELSVQFRILNDSLADSAFRSVAVEDPFNLASSEARRIGEVVGANAFILIRSALQRRAALGRSAYFEAFAIVYVVDSRTGHLLAWFIESVEGANEQEAARKLLARAGPIAEKVTSALKVNRSSAVRGPRFEEVPPEGSPLGKGLRTPVPYRRIRPEYTELASMYGGRATVDIEVDIDADGSIVRTSIERWAGFGLEASVEKAVRSMNWRPAERDGKPLPMRVLLRYNFVKVEKDEAP